MKIANLTLDITIANKVKNINIYNEFIYRYHSFQIQSKSKSRSQNNSLDYYNRRKETTNSDKEYVEDFVARTEVKKAKVKAVKPKTKVEAARKSTVPTKQSMATQIYRDLDGDKPLVIAKIQEQLVMSLAGATTYFYNAKKLA